MDVWTFPVISLFHVLIYTATYSAAQRETVCTPDDNPANVTLTCPQGFRISDQQANVGYHPDCVVPDCEGCSPSEDCTNTNVTFPDCSWQQNCTGTIQRETVSGPLGSGCFGSRQSNVAWVNYTCHEETRRRDTLCTPDDSPVSVTLTCPQWWSVSDVQANVGYYSGDCVDPHCGACIPTDTNCQEEVEFVDCGRQQQCIGSIQSQEIIGCGGEAQSNVAWVDFTCQEERSESCFVEEIITDVLISCDPYIIDMTQAFVGYTSECDQCIPQYQCCSTCGDSVAADCYQQVVIFDPNQCRGELSCTINVNRRFHGNCGGEFGSLSNFAHVYHNCTKQHGDTTSSLPDIQTTDASTIMTTYTPPSPDATSGYSPSYTETTYIETSKMSSEAPPTTRVIPDRSTAIPENGIHVLYYIAGGLSLVILVLVITIIVLWRNGTFRNKGDKSNDTGGDTSQELPVDQSVDQSPELDSISNIYSNECSPPYDDNSAIYSNATSDVMITDKVSRPLLSVPARPQPTPEKNTTLKNPPLMTPKAPDDSGVISPYEMVELQAPKRSKKHIKKPSTPPPLPPGQVNPCYQADVTEQALKETAPVYAVPIKKKPKTRIKKSSSTSGKPVVAVKPMLKEMSDPGDNEEVYYNSFRGSGVDGDEDVYYNSVAEVLRGADDDDDVELADNDVYSS